MNTTERRSLNDERTTLLNGESEKHEAMFQVLVTLFSLYGVPAPSDDLPGILQNLPRGNSLIPLMHLFTVSMHLDTGPWPRNGPNAPYGPTNDDVPNDPNPPDMMMTREDGVRSLYQMFYLRKKWMDRLREYVLSYLLIKVPPERWPENAAGQYHKVGVTAESYELAREMEPHVKGSVLRPLLGEDYVPRWWIASRMF